MATIEALKQAVPDLHDLAERLGLERPGGAGNYRSPHHADKSPSLSVYGSDAQRWKDFSTDEGGDAIDLVAYVEGCAKGEAIRRLGEIYGVTMERARQEGPVREKSLAEHIAERSLVDPSPAVEYLVGRQIAEEVVQRAVRRRVVGFQDYRSAKVEAGQPGHGGPAVVFVVRALNPGHVAAVDLRYLDPDLNGGQKTGCQGERQGVPWIPDVHGLQRAESVYVVESPVNALSIETAGVRRAAAIAVRGLGVDAIDWRFLAGKRVVICLDNDEAVETPKGPRWPGQWASWALYERLTTLNIAAHLVDQGEWEHNDVNDFLQAEGPEELRYALGRLEPWLIPGTRGDDKGRAKNRVFLPSHDFAQYWRYRVKEDFTSLCSKKVDKETGDEREVFSDLCGFRVAGVSRVTVASAVATMTGEEDTQPQTLFAVTVQAPRHGAQLQRRVFEDERLHNVDQWQKLGPVYNRGAFLRMVNILERGTHLGARDAVNFVGLAWRNGRPIVNEGPDCYFTEPDKQCPYHNLTFPGGTVADARRVALAYQETFRQNAATLALVWALGGHLKAFLGFWPHMIMQADKGMGKSTLIKRLERTIAFTMFSGQSLQTEFRLLTSISHTSHPVGWEEISARRQDVIDKAVGLLQESYQYTVTRRGSDMTEYLNSAPVLLAGEDVPVRSLLGKVVRTDLTGKKGPLLPEDLPRFPVRPWLEYLAKLNRGQVQQTFAQAREWCMEHCRASGADDGARRMAGNYAAVMTAWRLLCEFCGLDRDQGAFLSHTLTVMNDHVAETSADREPWVWILETLLSEIEAGSYRHPFTFSEVEREPCLCVRPGHVMDHIAHSMALREKWNMLPVKSARVFKRQLVGAGVLASEDVERAIEKKRYAHLVAISVERIERFGLHVAVPELEDIFQ